MTAAFFVSSPALSDAESIEPGWQARGACRGIDPDLFFAERGENSTTAKATCRGCPVREACLEYALATKDQYGVWGGYSPQERNAMRRRRRRRSVA